jgi:hypothetical protein
MEQKSIVLIMSTPEKMGIAKLVNCVTMYLKLKMYGGVMRYGEQRKTWCVPTNTIHYELFCL